MARQRIVAGVAAQLSWQATDQDGEPSDPGTTTVAVTGSDGTVVLAAGTATTEAGSSRTVDIEAQDVDLLTVVWTGASASATTYVDVVGGVYFTVAGLRAAQSSVNNSEDYPPADVFAARQVVETVFEREVGTSFVPRLVVVPVAAQFAPLRHVRSVRWARYADGTFVTDLDDLADATEIEDAGVRCYAGFVELGVVAGLDQPPDDVRRAAMLYCRHLLTEETSQIDWRVLALETADGARMPVATPGDRQWITGLPTVDEVILSYRRRARRTPRPIVTGAWFR